MQLEDYFDFIMEPVETIRIKDTRMSLDAVLYAFNQGMTPDQIVVYYGGSVLLEEVYASITYYLHHKPRIDAYLKESHERDERLYQEYLKQEPSPVVKRLREIKAQKASQTS